MCHFVNKWKWIITWWFLKLNFNGYDAQTIVASQHYDPVHCDPWKWPQKRVCQHCFPGYMMICLMWSYLVSQSEVTLASLQQEPCDVRVAPLRCEHQRCGSLAVLDVSVCPTAKQQANHHNSAMSHCQVQSCLARLCGEGESVRPRPSPLSSSAFILYLLVVSVLLTSIL